MTVCRLLAAVGAGGQLNLPESNRQPEAVSPKARPTHCVSVVSVGKSAACYSRLDHHG